MRFRVIHNLQDKLTIRLRVSLLGSMASIEICIQSFDRSKARFVTAHTPPCSSNFSLVHLSRYQMLSLFCDASCNDEMQPWFEMLLSSRFRFLYAAVNPFFLACSENAQLQSDFQFLNSRPIILQDLPGLTHPV